MKGTHLAVIILMVFTYCLCLQCVKILLFLCGMLIFEMECDG